MGDNKYNFDYLTPRKVKERRGRIIPVRTEKKVGRNEPCPCGSGKKYKRCCWLANERQRENTTKEKK